MRRYRIGPFEVRGARLVLACNAKQVAAGPKVVDTLAALIELRAAVATKATLLERIWPRCPSAEANLAQNVHVLRRLFREHGVDDAIETLPGVGYQLKLPVGAFDEPTPTYRRALGFALFTVAVFAAVLCVGSFAARLRPDAAGPAVNAPQIERLYAIGRYYWNLRTSDAVRKSVKYFGEVIDRDPQSPLGYTGMADAYATIGDYCYGTHRPAIYFARAKAYARQALLLDPGFPPARATLGFLLLHQKRLHDAAIELRRAIDADPSYAPAHEWYGLALAAQGKIEGARTEMTLASQLAPLSVASTVWLARIDDRERRFVDARLYARDARALGGRFERRRLPPRHSTWAAVEEPAAAEIAP